MKMRPVGAGLFYADGQTDMTKLIVAFRNFANAPKKGLSFFFGQRIRKGFSSALIFTAVMKNVTCA